jgi:hypothetical protein
MTELDCLCKLSESDYYSRMLGWFQSFCHCKQHDWLDQTWIRLLKVLSCDVLVLIMAAVIASYSINTGSY